MTEPRPAAVRIVAIAGGSGSGKTTFARRVLERLGPGRCAILSQDAYYLDQSARFDGDGGAVNFDDPEALDFALLARQLEALRRGEGVEVPCYDFASHTRLARTEPFAPVPVVLLDGTLVLTQAALRFDHSVFLEVPQEVRFERRLRRDVAERGRDEAGVRRQFERQVAPMHDRFVQPSAGRASLLIRHGEDIEDHLERLLPLLKG